MSMNIEIEPNISLQDAQDAMNSGTSVMRSAHVGNLRGYNLTIANMGIPLLLVDHNIVIQKPEDREGQYKQGDANYLPGSIVTREKITPLKVSHLGDLSLRTEVIAPTSGDMCFLDTLHAQSVRDAFPATSVVTNTEYLRSQESLAGEAITIALSSNPELFKRVIEADGTIRKTEGSYAQLFDQYGILQLNDDPRTERGLLIPNDVDIVVNFIIESLRSEKDTQIHLSGPDMVQYLKSETRRSSLAELYETIRNQASFGGQLPASLRVKLVPSAEARFVTTSRQVRVAQQIFNILNKKELLVAAEKKAFFKSPESRDARKKACFLEAKKVQERGIDVELTSLVQEIPEIFAEAPSAPYVSQYDLLDGEEIGMPAENTSLTMHELKQITKRLQRLQKGAP